MTPTLLLLHGAGTGAWIWERVLGKLRSRALAPDVPDGVPDAVADTLVADLDAGDVDLVVPVLHSVTGVLAGPLAERLGDRLARLVFLSAVVPANGDSFADALGEPNGSILRQLFGQNPDGLTPPAEMIRAEYCGDLVEPDCERVLEAYRPQMPGLFVTPVPLPTAAIPSTYVKLTDDHSVPPDLQDQMIARLSEPRVELLEAGHLAMLSQPVALAAVLDEAAELAAR